MSKVAKRDNYINKDVIHKAKCCAYCMYYSRRTVIDGFCDKHPGDVIERTYICNLFVGKGENCKLSTHAPCPKCGSRRLYIPRLGEWEVYYNVACRDCLYIGPYGNTKNAAWEAYDKDVEQKKLKEMEFAESMKRLFSGGVK